MAKTDFKSDIADVRSKIKNFRTKSSQPHQPKPPINQTQVKNAFLEYGLIVLALLVSLGISIYGIGYAAGRNVWWYVPIMAGTGYLVYANWGVTGKFKHKVLHGLTFAVFLGATVGYTLMRQQPIFRVIVSALTVILLFVYSRNVGFSRQISRRVLHIACALAVGAGFMVGMDMLLPYMLTLSIWHSVWLLPVLVFLIACVTTLAMKDDLMILLGILAGVVALIKGLVMVGAAYGFWKTVGCFLVMLPVGAIVCWIAILILMNVMDAE